MDSICNDLLDTIYKFSDAGECCLLNFNLEILTVEEAVKTKNIRFILFYLKTCIIKLIEHAAYYDHLTFIAFVSKLEVYNQMATIVDGRYPRYSYKQFLHPTPELEQHIKAALHGLVRKSDIIGIERLAGWDELGFDNSELMTDLMVVAINHKSYNVISYLTSTGPAPQCWSPPDWDLEKIFKANYDRDTALLDYVVQNLILENMESEQYNYFEDWQFGLNCMLEKNDHLCAEYFRNKLINNINPNEHTSNLPQWLDY